MYIRGLGEVAARREAGGDPPGHREGDYHHYLLFGEL